jgi:succinyl-diaminopimelate desuccinylase
VPDHCEMEVDRRTLPGEAVEDVLGEIQSVLDGLKAEIPDLRARLVSHEWAEASETPPGTRVVELLKEAAGAFGVEPYELGYSGATDARFLINQGGIPSVVFGVGDLLVAHTTGEFLEVDQLVQGARIYAHTFARFLGA